MAYAQYDEMFALVCAKLGRAHGRLSQCYLEIGDARLCLEAANEYLSSAKEHNDEHGQAVGGSRNSNSRSVCHTLRHHECFMRGAPCMLPRT